MSGQTTDIIDRISDAVFSASDKLITSIVAVLSSLTIVIILAVLAVKGIRALRRWQISLLKYERYFSSGGTIKQVMTAAKNAIIITVLFLKKLWNWRLFLTATAMLSIITPLFAVGYYTLEPLLCQRVFSIYFNCF